MQRNLLIIFIALLTVLLPMTASCQQRKSSSLKVKVLETIPHGTNIYTQGLFIEGDILYESSGQYGSSFFRSANLKTGQTLKTFALPSNYFAEGAVMLNDKIYLLTWMEKIVFVIDKNSFKEIGKLNNPREGWGLTTDGTYLIMSDGSHNLFFNDPMNFMTKKTLEVKLNGIPVKQLNELEWIEGEIWANVYMTDTIVIINPQTGNVRATINCSGLLPASLRSPRTDVLNGIAYDKTNKQVYLTGKYWPRMFRVSVQ